MTVQGSYAIVHGDVLATLRALPSNSFDALLSDPPYGLRFMGQRWDYDVPSVEVWKEALRVLKPGAPLLSFGGTRTFHRIAVAIEDAGFELRDCLMWLYGCLSEDTEILVDGEWRHFSEATEGRLTLAYDAERNVYAWQPIEKLYVYREDGIAFRLHSEHTDQIVSRGHRCLVEEEGKYVFRIAEKVAQDRQARVPVIQDLPGLLSALPLPQPLSSPIRVESGSQAVRGARFTRPDLVRVEAIRYSGLIWCVKVPTGAFVARRNGKVFVTGNSGFPKSQDVSKAIDKAAGATREVIGRNPHARPGDGKCERHATAGVTSHAADLTAPSTDLAKQWDGYGSALKPAWEPIVLARKPMDGAMAANVTRWGVGGLAIDACRIGRPEGDHASGWSKTGSKASENVAMSGANYAREAKPDAPARWPANLILDEEAAALLDASVPPTRSPKAYRPKRRTLTPGAVRLAPRAELEPTQGYGDSGGPSRFFYVSKVSTREREKGCEDLPGGNAHPTLKPLALTRWLASLIRPPTGGQLLIPYSGSGSEMIGALQAGWDLVCGIEAEDEYNELATARINAWCGV